MQGAGAGQIITSTKAGDWFMQQEQKNPHEERKTFLNSAQFEPLKDKDG